MSMSGAERKLWSRYLGLSGPLCLPLIFMTQSISLPHEKHPEQSALNVTRAVNHLGSHGRNSHRRRGHSCCFPTAAPLPKFLSLCHSRINDWRHL